jgi:hypothetical protein
MYIKIVYIYVILMIAQTQSSVLLTETHMNNFEVNVTDVTLKKGIILCADSKSQEYTHPWSSCEVLHSLMCQKRLKTGVCPTKGYSA